MKLQKKKLKLRIKETKIKKGQKQMKKQEKITVSRTVAKYLDDLVLQHKEETGISCNRIYENALKEYFEKRGKINDVDCVR